MLWGMAGVTACEWGGKSWELRGWLHLESPQTCKPESFTESNMQGLPSERSDALTLSRKKKLSVRGTKLILPGRSLFPLAEAGLPGVPSSGRRSEETRAAPRSCTSWKSTSPSASPLTWVWPCLQNFLGSAETQGP